MSSEIAIDLQDLGKCYHIYRNPRDRLIQGLWRGKRKLYREFWALRDVSFQVRKGETVGIVGRNGSGKSTLLQLLCGTLTPSTGTYQVHGRVAALLELGAGFNPEFTGRENVLMKSTILGLSREESKARYQSIEDFADIGDFIDQPVKTYSSGMYVRLAFAVAINVDPAILVVDEALAVGDEAFRRKCYSRIEQIRQNGATVLFVSHSAQAIVQLCNRAILMEGGEYLLSGEPKQVVGEYQKLLYAPKEKAPALRQRLREHPNRFNYEGELDNFNLMNTDDQEAGENNVPQQGLRADYDPNLISQSTIYYEQHGAKIEDPHLEDVDGQRVNVLLNRHLYVYTFKVTFTDDAYNVRFGMGLKTTAGFQLGGAQSYRRGDYDPIATVNAGETLQVRFRLRCMLVPGSYFLNCAVQGVLAGEEVVLDRQIDAVMFRVVQNGRSFDHGPSDFLLSASILGRDELEETLEMEEDAAELPA